MFLLEKYTVFHFVFVLDFFLTELLIFNNQMYNSYIYCCCEIEIDESLMCDKTRVNEFEVLFLHYLYVGTVLFMQINSRCPKIPCT